MTLSLLWDICLLFAGLFALGTLACLPLYRWRLQAFLRSSLWIKILWWIPIFAGFVAVLYTTLSGAVFVVFGLIALACRELVAHRRRLRLINYIYFGGFVIALSHLIALFVAHTEATAVHILIAVCFCSVLSDVCAFFLGSYASRHALPTWINPGKSWEGVFGQVLGSLLGGALIMQIVDVPHLWMLALVIGVASAWGDLANSIAKRTLRIKDWGSTIPGHGGVLDRFSSLSAAIAAAYWFTRLW